MLDKMTVQGLMATVVLLAAVWLPHLVHADTVYPNVPIAANAEISGAGNAGLPDPDGVLPVVLNLPSNPSILAAESVTGSITLQSGGAYNDADGVVVSGAYSNIPLNTNGTYSYMGPYGGLSGITAPGAGYLVGVFETSTGPVGVAPPSLNFLPTSLGGIGTNFSSLSPALNQVFYIGDGLTGDGFGSLQQFLVPTGRDQAGLRYLGRVGL